MQIHEGIKDNEDGFIQSSQLYKISTARISPKHLSCIWNENQRQVCAGPQTYEAPHTKRAWSRGSPSCSPLPPYPTPHWNSSEVYLTGNRKPAITQGTGVWRKNRVFPQAGHHTRAGHEGFPSESPHSNGDQQGCLFQARRSINPIKACL